MKHFKIIFFLFIIGCSPKISRQFEYNKYINNYSTHIVNDSLELYFKTPGDINYFSSKKQLKRIIKNRKTEFNNRVLVYGTTRYPPYEYFVTIGKEIKIKNKENTIRFDTIVGNNLISFIGYPLAANAKPTLKIDLENIFNTLEMGVEYRKDISTVMEIVQRYDQSNKFYQALDQIQKFPAYDEQEEWTKLQMELTYASFLSNNKVYYKLLNKLESRFKPRNTIINIMKTTGYINSDALEQVVENAKNHQLILINENHFFPNHRVFVAELLPRLKKIGYSILALEALGKNQDSLLNMKNGYPTLKTGFYTREQNFGNLIRSAKTLNFEFVAYENTDPSKERELGQAQNLFNKTFKKNPDAKVIVLAGLDHILEEPTSNGKRWMATIFKDKFGIDPLSISQSHLNNYRSFLGADYKLIEGKNFQDEKLNSIDFLLLNNKTTSSIGKTGYTYINPEKIHVQVALYYKSEIENDYFHHSKVPFYTTVLSAGKSIELPIPKGRKIYLYSYNINGRTVSNETISSKNK